mgnify:CR=1 FL=1
MHVGWICVKQGFVNAAPCLYAFHAAVALLQDISWLEVGILSILAFVILSIGLYPSMLVDILAPSVEKLVSASLVSKIGIVS